MSYGAMPVKGGPVLLIVMSFVVFCAPKYVLVVWVCDFLLLYDLVQRTEAGEVMLPK